MMNIPRKIRRPNNISRNISSPTRNMYGPDVLDIMNVTVLSHDDIMI